MDNFHFSQSVKCASFFQKELVLKIHSAHSGKFTLKFAWVLLEIWFWLTISVWNLTILAFNIYGKDDKSPVFDLANSLWAVATIWNGFCTLNLKYPALNPTWHWFTFDPPKWAFFPDLPYRFTLDGMSLERAQKPSFFSLDHQPTAHWPSLTIEKSQKKILFEDYQPMNMACESDCNTAKDTYLVVSSTRGTPLMFYFS